MTNEQKKTIREALNSIECRISEPLTKALEAALGVSLKPDFELTIGSIMKWKTSDNLYQVVRVNRTQCGIVCTTDTCYLSKTGKFADYVKGKVYSLADFGAEHLADKVDLYEFED